jgi:hypothetical protein
MSDNCELAQIINSFDELAFAQLKLAGSPTAGTPKRSAVAQISHASLLVIDVLIPD